MSHIERLVARQLEYCELRRRREEQEAALDTPPTGPPRPPPAPGPCILVSRERGSGGGAIARRVGERLGWQVFDREIVEEIARRAHIRQQLVESVDEHVRSRWRLHLRTPATDEPLGWRDYLHQLQEIILALGHHGHVVLVGRGAQWILPHEGSLRVRVIAPPEARAQRVVASDGLTLEEARQVLEETDHQRVVFQKRAFGQDPRDPRAYDLVINTGELDLNTAVKLVLEAAEGRLGVRPEATACSL